METPVPFPVRRPVSPLPEINLTQRYESVDSDQVCRTCAHNKDRSWAYSRQEYLKMLATPGVNPSDLQCNIAKPTKLLKVLSDHQATTKVVDISFKTKVATVGLVESCGHKIANKCKGCDRFVAEQVGIPYARSGASVHWRINDAGVREPYTSDGSAVAWWNVSVGGHCSIPADGIVVNGKRVTCDPQARKINIENPSCANCYYLDYKGEQWQQDYLTVNENAALTPWEREQALARRAEDQTSAMAIGIALWRKQTQNYGRHIWYPAILLDQFYDGGRLKYKVRFRDSLVTAIIADGDPRFEVHRLADPELVAVDVAWPYNRMFNLRLPTKYKPLVWPKLPAKVETHSGPHPNELYNPTCPRCRKPTETRDAKPCYFHAKAPHYNVDDGEMTFTNPKGIATEREWPAHGRLEVKIRNDEIVVVDGNENFPTAYGEDVANASVFRLWLPTLVDQARRRFGAEGVNVVNRQFGEVCKGLKRASKARAMRPSWYVNSGIEPAKPTCSHPGGEDLRRVFQDSFGSERTDWKFDTGASNSLEVEEELRVGYRQHNQTPQRLHEEILATISSHPMFDPALGDIRHPEVNWDGIEWRTERLEAIGGMTREDGTPVTDPSEFVDRLDELAIIGEHGESPRFVSKRQQLFGYDISRGYYGKRRGSEKTAMPAGDSEYVIFDTSSEDDQVDNTDMWRCADCGANYSQDDITDTFYPVCSNCGSDLYMNHSTRDTIYLRARGGIGNAMAKDTKAMQTRRLLSACICPNWRLQSSKVITLDDVKGPSKGVPAAATPKVTPVEADGPTIFKVGVLTDEHKRVNAAYREELDKVLAQRAQYKERYPHVSTAELTERFPTPTGTIYQIKAAGSLAKMGGV